MSLIASLSKHAILNTLFFSSIVLIALNKDGHIIGVVARTCYSEFVPDKLSFLYWTVCCRWSVEGNNNKPVVSIEDLLRNCRSQCSSQFDDIYCVSLSLLIKHFLITNSTLNVSEIRKQMSKARKCWLFRLLKRKFAVVFVWLLGKFTARNSWQEKMLKIAFLI